MSFLGMGGGSQQGSGLSNDRVEMAIQEYVPFRFVGVFRVLIYFTELN